MPDEPQSPRTAPTWDANVRSWVSLLLFIHLFAIGVAVTTYTRPSVLQERLHQFFAVYLRNLHMTAYPYSYPFARFHLTHAMPGDVDFACEIEVTGPAASDGTKSQTVVVPEAGLQPGIRFRRYQALANATGTLAGGEASDEYNGILPKAIAGAILQQRDAKQALFRCRAHYLPEMESMEEVDAGRRGALERYATTYEAQVFITPAGVELLKKSATLEVAPVESKRKGASGPGPAKSSAPSTNTLPSGATPSPDGTQLPNTSKLPTSVIPSGGPQP